MPKAAATDRKSTRLNSSHRCISYAVFCLKKNKNVGSVALGADKQALFGHQFHCFQRRGVAVVVAELVVDLPHGRRSQRPEDGKNVELRGGWDRHRRSVAA